MVYRYGDPTDRQDVTMEVNQQTGCDDGGQSTDRMWPMRSINRQDVTNEVNQQTGCDQ